MTQSTAPFLEWNCLPIQMVEELIILEDKDCLESLMYSLHQTFGVFIWVNYLTVVRGDYKEMTSAIMSKQLFKKTSFYIQPMVKREKKFFAALTFCQAVSGKAKKHINQSTTYFAYSFIC